MTNEEFLRFDTSIFYKPGYENELKYMGALTAYFLACKASTANNYNYAKANNKAVPPNKWNGWFKSPKLLLRDLLSPSKTGSINPAHPQANEFIKRYEALCKTFLKAYDEQYETIAKDDMTKAEYYTANISDQITQQIYDKTDTNSIFFDQVMKAGFVDLRISLCYSLDEKKERFVKNEYSYDMADASDSFSRSLAEFTSNLAPESPTAKPRTKQ